MEANEACNYIVDENRAFCVQCTKCSTTMKMIMERIGRMEPAAAAVDSNKPIRHPQHAIIIKHDFIASFNFSIWTADAAPAVNRNSTHPNNFQIREWFEWNWLRMAIDLRRTSCTSTLAATVPENCGRIFCRRNELWPRIITHKHTGTQTRQSLHFTWDSKRNCVRTLSASLKCLWCGCRLSLLPNLPNNIIDCFAFMRKCYLLLHLHFHFFNH